MSDQKRTSRDAIQEMTRRAYESGGQTQAREVKQKATEAAKRQDRRGDR